MKNTFKLGFLALAISISVSACSSDKKALGTSDSSKVDSSASTTNSTTDTTKTDTTKKP